MSGTKRGARIGSESGIALKRLVGGPIMACWLVLFCGVAWGATPDDTDVDRLVPARIIDGDTVPFFSIYEVIIVPQRKFKNQKQYREYQRLIHNLKIVYPYAQQAKLILEDVDSVYAATTSNSQRRKYTYAKEKELHKQFERQIRNLTYSQGHLLIKLIHRETRRTAYEIIETFRGKMSAGFWQLVAKLFTSDLKSSFAPEDQDRILNELIILYEHGEL